MTTEKKEANRLFEIELIEKAITLLNESFLPQNLECDGAYCMGCWKDKVKEAIEFLKLATSKIGN